MWQHKMFNKNKNSKNISSILQDIWLYVHSPVEWRLIDMHVTQ